MSTTIFAQLLIAIEDLLVLPGDCVLYRFGGISPLQRAIAHVQRRALEDLRETTCQAESPALESKWTLEEQQEEAHGSSSRRAGHFPLRSISLRPVRRDLHWYTHAGLVLDACRTVEQTSPRTRTCLWGHRLRGVSAIAIVRPVGSPSPDLLRHASVEAYEDVLHRVRYPYREIALYWLWSWGWKKLHGRTPFASVFRDRNRNVCSGSVIEWYTRACIPLGLSGQDAWPESWYPARLLADTFGESPHFQLVAQFATA